jgi:hypothetical protein
MANDMKSELVDPCFDELSRWAESDEFFDAMDAAARSGNSDGTALRHAQEIIRHWLGK